MKKRVKSMEEEQLLRGAKLAQHFAIGLSGRCGDYVFYTMNGKIRMRYQPKQVNNPKSEAQMKQRERFALGDKRFREVLAELKERMGMKWKPEITYKVQKMCHAAVEEVDGKWVVNEEVLKMKLKNLYK